MLRNVRRAGAGRTAFGLAAMDAEADRTAARVDGLGGDAGVGME
jgi:hypothetical protein